MELVCKDLNIIELVPVLMIPTPVKADSFYYLRPNFVIGARLSRRFFNTSLGDQMLLRHL